MEAVPEIPVPPKTVRFVTFGCKVNQYDTQVLREKARRSGITESDADADVIVVNTCTVTGHGAALARKAVRRLAREHPRARILVTGCYAVSDPEEAATLPHVAGVLPNEQKARLARILGGTEDRRPFIEQTVEGLRRHTRAFVKVQDGCPLRCAYCIVPRVRPAVISKAPDTALAEVRSLVARGHREVVLTGIHLGAYGRDSGPAARGGTLVGLVRRILAETDLERLRISSLEANEVTDDLIELLAGEPRLAPHLHLPLQSGSPRVLRRMRRRYGPEEYLGTVERIRSRVAGIAFSTDVIVGFPGETRKDHRATLAVMRHAEVMRTHVFPFSPRPGTPAASFDGAVGSREVRARAAEAESEGRRLARAFVLARRGGPATVLVEGRAGGPGPSVADEARRGGALSGFTEHYVRVSLEGTDDLVGRLVPIRYGEPLDVGARALR
jgi:threonylcarbamoyladenosine tRNA methylthiotransferase MtaB